MYTKIERVVVTITNKVFGVWNLECMEFLINSNVNFNPD